MCSNYIKKNVCGNHIETLTAELEAFYFVQNKKRWKPKQNNDGTRNKIKTNKQIRALLDSAALKWNKAQRGNFV